MSYRSGMWQSYTPLWSSVNHAQYVIATGGTSGTFTLTYSGQTTASINWNASAASVQTALRALSNLADADVVCTGGPLPNSSVVISFQGALIATAVANLTVTDNITNGTATITGEPALGNGTIAGRYRVHGKSIDVEITMRPGSTSTYGTNGAGYAWSLPTAIVDALADISTTHEYHGSGYIGGSLQHWPITTIVHGLANLASTTDRPEMRAICHANEGPTVAFTASARLSNAVSLSGLPAGFLGKEGDSITVDYTDNTLGGTDGTFTITDRAAAPATSLTFPETAANDVAMGAGTIKLPPQFGSAGNAGTVGLEGAAQPVGWFGSLRVPDSDAFVDGAYWCLSNTFELA